MNSNWVHEDGVAYWKSRGNKALEVAKRVEKERKEKQLCHKK